MKKNINNLSFEDSLKKLEDIVDQLDSGEVDLEKSVELYEKGMELKKICEEKLKKVELQIKKIKSYFSTMPVSEILIGLKFANLDSNFFNKPDKKNLLTLINL